MGHILVKKGFKIAQWVIPAVLLYFIYRKIDFQALLSVFKKADFLIVLLFFFNNPIKYVIFVIRWFVITRVVSNKYIPLEEIVGFYSAVYKGLFLGYFTPGSLGADVYRVYKIGQKYQQFETQTGIIVIEKIMGIMAFASMILISYPFVKDSLPESIKQVISLSFTILTILFVLFFLFFLFMKRKAGIYKIANWGIGKVNASVNSLLTKVVKNKHSKVDAKKILHPLMSIKLLCISFGASILIQIVGAFMIYVLFFGFGVQVPFLVNLFLVPLINLIFLFPISFGGIGLRETAYVVLYGAFGVSAETALLVAVLSFIFLLINNSLGGFIMMLGNLKKD